MWGGIHSGMAHLQSIDVQVDPGGVAPSSADTGAIVSSVQALYAAIPLSELRFVRQVAGPPRVFEYAIEAIDGRQWVQSIRFHDDGSPVGMTFDVPDYWQIAEFSLQRRTRDLLVSLAGKTIGLVKLELSWG